MGFADGLGVVLISLICAVVLKEFGAKSIPVLVSVCVLGVISLYSEIFFEIIGLVDRLTEMADCRDYARAGIKIVGVGYLSGIVSDVCDDLGERGLARAAALVGRLEIAVICIPYLEKIVGSIENVF